MSSSRCLLLLPSTSRRLSTTWASRESPRVSSRAGRTSSSTSRRSSPARRRPISTRATASTSTEPGAVRGDPGGRRILPARRLRLVDRRLRAAVPRRDRRRLRHRAADELRNAEGDLRAAPHRLHPPRLPRRRRDPAADHLRAAGRAEPGGVGVLLEHHPRAAERARGGAAGSRRHPPLARVAAGRGRVSPPCRNDRERRLGDRRCLTMPGVSVTVGEQIEALRARRRR